MGIGINKEEVDLAATIVGCSMFSPPFKYLRVQVGDNMSRLTSWKDVKAKISSMLSRWKLKTLSIGGRLTLLKSVLTAIPLYYMSLFKVPIGILNSMELILRNFFNGIGKSERKMSLIRWDNILVSKKFGGLGVSSFNAIYGVRGAHNNHIITSNRNSIWLDIIRDLSSLNRKGIDLLAYVRKKVGDGDNSLFWDDIWIEVTLPQVNDRWFWSLDSSGEFSVKSDCNLIDDSILPKSDVPTRWVKLAHIKVNILAWKIRLDRLPTRINLFA
ncbi:hypothetical protein Tco_0390208 [Tanacetum coccineum]